MPIVMDALTKSFVDGVIDAVYFTEALDNSVDEIDSEDLLCLEMEARVFLKIACAKGWLDRQTSNLQQAGHDFWLTRNQHGAGFWDGDWPDHGHHLTDLCEIFGSLEVYKTGPNTYATF